MATLRANCASSGYLSLTKYITDTLASDKKTKTGKHSLCIDADIPDWLNSKVEALTQQIRGIATNYNQSVAVMNTLVKSLNDRKVKYVIIKQTEHLNSLTKEMISNLRDIKDIVRKISDDNAIDDYMADD